MPRIDSSANIPPVNEGSHTLRLESAELVEGTAYQQPDVPETKLEIQFRVITVGEDQVAFKQQVSLNLGEKATLGNISRAILRTKKLPREGIDTDDLIGGILDCMVGHSEGGWPKVVNGSCYPSRQNQRPMVGSAVAPSSQVQMDDVPWDDDNEPPF